MKSANNSTKVKPENALKLSQYSSLEDCDSNTNSENDENII